MHRVTVRDEDVLELEHEQGTYLDGSTLNPLEAKENGTAVLQGTTVKLKAEAADLLNKTFKIEALKEGLVIGVATITVNTA